MENSQEHLLEELETHLVVASTGKRLVNYFVDSFVFLVLATIVMIVYFFLNPDLMETINEEESSLVETVIYIISYGLFMGLYEAVFKGKTLGKLITGTKAVNNDGSTISFKTAMLRGISRCVPFEAFTAFGTRMWHDEWNDTYVIDVKQSTIIENK
jgi:uncharacterized RDD family membrane protein YckC